MNTVKKVEFPIVDHEGNMQEILTQAFHTDLIKLYTPVSCYIS